MIRRILKTENLAKSTEKESGPLHLEKRRCARTSIGVPISCVSVDSAAKPLDRNRGIIKNVSQAGLRIEADDDVRSDRLKLAFIDLNKKIAEITCKVVSSKMTSSGTYKIGVKLQGNKLDILRFVSKLVRFHHYTKRLIN